MKKNLFIISLTILIIISGKIYTTESYATTTNIPPIAAKNLLTTTTLPATDNFPILISTSNVRIMFTYGVGDKILVQGKKNNLQNPFLRWAKIINFIN